MFLGIADCWLDDVAMVWEIESTEWHLSPEDHDRTVERAAAFTAAGAIYTAIEAEEDSGRIRAGVAANPASDLRAGRGPPSPALARGPSTAPVAAKPLSRN